MDTGCNHVSEKPVTLEEALEFNRCETREAAGEGFEEASIAV